MTPPAVRIRRGLHPGQRGAAARLYWLAFGGKLGPVMGPEARALAHVERVLSPDHAIAAEDEAGRLVGIAGFRSPAGAFVGGGFAELAASYGLAGGALRAAAFALLSREVDNHRFLVDGIAVVPDRRSEGIGAALIEALCAEAADRGYDAVRLDVVAENLRARALYERLGFVPEATTAGGLTARVFGFAAATTMVRRLGRPA